MADARCQSDALKRIKQFTYPAVGSVDIVLGDVFLDVVQIKVGIFAENIPIHPLDFMRCSDLRLSRSRASAGLTCLPLSSESTRRPSS